MCTICAFTLINNRVQVSRKSVYEKINLRFRKPTQNILFRELWDSDADLY